MEKEGIDITILKGDKLFNENTPFVVNIFSPDKDLSNKRSYADLICVIDASSSMRGNKIYEVKESLKILIQLMDKNDRIALILFNKFSHIYSGLEYITDETVTDNTKDNSEKSKPKYYSITLLFDSEEEMVTEFDKLVDEGYNCRMSDS